MSRLSCLSAGLIALLLLVSATATAQSSGDVLVSAQNIVAPLFKRLSHNAAIRVRIDVPRGRNYECTAITLRLDPASVASIETVELFAGDEVFDANNAIQLASVKAAGSLTMLFKHTCKPGITYLWISVSLKDQADIDEKIALSVSELVIGGVPKKPTTAQDEGSSPFRMGIAVRKVWDDSVHTYRIPGIIATNTGTLIAVYDVRYRTSRDLPGDIDVGMSRSTDGGRTWEPMKIIMDMGPPHENNGIGDPAILFDPTTKTIWVAALWSKGDRSIAGSEPGLSPDSTGQFVLVHSNDDGITWSEPYNITAQVKDPKWHLYFQGPGTGIAMKDGTLVFPSQYWDETRKPGIPHSSIIYSTDHGKTWRSGIGAKANTTESQVVETTPGVLMLNMRDNRGKYRSIATTTDLGKTWVEHHTSRRALPDPVCMASIIKANVRIGSQLGDVLFFCNVATSSTRSNTTVKASLDLGESWPETNHLLIDERGTYGYSSLARIDEKTIGLLYEGERDLYFVRIPVTEVVSEP